MAIYYCIVQLGKIQFEKVLVYLCPSDYFSFFLLFVMREDTVWCRCSNFSLATLQTLHRTQKGNREDERKPFLQDNAFVRRCISLMIVVVVNSIVLNALLSFQLSPFAAIEGGSITIHWQLQEYHTSFLLLKLWCKSWGESKFNQTLLQWKRYIQSKV